MMSGVLGIIAGGGQFPFAVARAAVERGYRVVGVGFSTDTDPTFPGECDAYLWLKLGQLGKMLDFFIRENVTDVIMAGPVNKPRALDLRPDWRAAKLLFSLNAKGDDALLRAVSAELEREGMRVRAPHDFIPGLTTPAGVLTKRQPSQQERADMLFGWDIIAHLGDLDIGQCVVVREGIVLAVEAIEGTDATILRGGQLGGPGAVVVKRPKPHQDTRLDLPAIGVTTLQSMHEVKASCLVVAAGASLFFDQTAALDYANAHDMCIIGHS